MDFGHYNCRDYYISPHFAAATIVKDVLSHPRHESFDDLERRCRSPASSKPKFPLLKLPLELRQHIFSYLLPRTREHTSVNPLANHVRNFSAVKKRVERGMPIPKPIVHSGPSHVVWQRGNISLLSVCRQLHDECASLLYGNNTFLLFVTYPGITFRFSWLLPTGNAPSRRYNFLELLPKRYMALIKRIIVNIDHVDSYTGMVKFNVSGKGLTHGLRKQVQRLVNALQPTEDVTPEGSIPTHHAASTHDQAAERRLAKLIIRVSNANAVVDQIKTDVCGTREKVVKPSDDLEEMLEPFENLRGIREVAVSGAITDHFAASLTMKMRSLDNVGTKPKASRRSLDDTCTLPLCVYGNDL